MSPRIVWKTEDNILLNLNNLIETQTENFNSLRTLITKLYLMNWFKWKQWLLAFCVATTVNVQGATLDEWGESTPPISYQSAEEESKYEFSDWRNSHADYVSNQYSGLWYKALYLQLPSSDTPMVYLKVKLKDSGHVSSITFCLNNQDQSFTDGAIWISPSDCRLLGTQQYISFAARVTAPGVYPYTVEAYVSPDDETPVATWDATFHIMENMPAITYSSNLYDNSFAFDVVKGDLEANVYLEVGFYGTNGNNNRPTSFTADGFSTTDGRNWRTELMPIADKHYSATFTCEETVSGQFQIDLKDTYGNSICGTKFVRVCYPFVPATSDLEAIKRLASMNPTNTDLYNFVNNGLWKEDLYGTDANVKVEWAQNGDSAHVSRLEITNQENLTLDLTGLDYVGTLDLSSNKTIQAPLDLSHMSKLDQLYMYNGVSLTYNEVILPEEFNKSNIYATSKIREIGSPRENGDVEVPINTILDLSAFVGEQSEDGSTICSWRKNWQDIELNPVEEGSLKFKLFGEIGDHFSCTIRNNTFPNWKMETPQIYLIMGELNYNEADVAGLKKLATDNPQNLIIKNFVVKELWKEQSWGDNAYKIWLKWAIDENNNAVLTHIDLRLDDEYNQGTAPKTIDLTPFKHLIDFESNRLVYVEHIDFSQCKELQLISFSANEMKSLDVSACTKLRELHFMEGHTLTGGILYGSDDTHTIALETLNFKGCTQIEKLRIGRTKISSLDISSLPNLTSLTIEYCPNLTTIVGLEQTHLSSFSLINTRSMYQEQIAKMNFSLITHLDYRGSDYPLPDPSSLANLEEISFPVNVTSFDCAQYPKLRWLEIWKSQIKYSTVKNYRTSIGRWGISTIEIPKAESLKWYPCVMPGDTIDLSSEAVIQDNPSTFIWINERTRTEETDLFMPTDLPGVFVVNPDVPVEKDTRYRCRIWNKTYSDGAGVDRYNGWILDTEQIKVIDGAAYDEQELNMLQTIVNNSSSQGLKDWWENGQWMFGNYYEEDGNFYVEWNNNYRLRRLQIWRFEDRMSGLLDLSAAKELENLYVDKTDLSSCVFAASPTVSSINLGTSKMALPIDVEFPSLQSFYPSPAQQKLDLSKLPALKEMGLYNARFKFSDVIEPRPIEGVYGSHSWMVSEKQYSTKNYFGTEDTQIMDFSSETNIGVKVKWTASGKEITVPEIESGRYNFSAALNQHKSIRAVLTHETFPRWYIDFNAILYTEQGDANIDGTVNVQDISATIPYVLNDWRNQLSVFGHYQADIDANKAIDVADILGILNIIRGRNYSNLRSSFSPVVHLTSEEDGKLYIQTPVALAGLQFTITGADQEIPLLGEAGRFAHAGHAGDSLRMVAYSMDGSTIPAGRTLIAQLPKGATLVEAVIADEQARSLEVDLNGVVTATEDVWSDVLADDVTNSPNPFRGQTTFRYGVNESADAVVIRIYSANGMLVRVLSGLPATQGEHQYPVSLDLPQGLYYYQLEISRGGKPIRTLSNNMIIK